jgi:hypothetical protein
MMSAMSEDSPRTIKDYYARVTLQRHHIGNPPESDERIEVVVRIPEEVARTLAGGGKPEVVIFDVGSRVRNVATETAGVPNDSSLVVAVVSTVDTVMPPSLPTESNFKDQDGAEGWILQPKYPAWVGYGETQDCVPLPVLPYGLRGVSDSGSRSAIFPVLTG